MPRSRGGSEPPPQPLPLRQSPRASVPPKMTNPDSTAALLRQRGGGGGAPRPDVNSRRSTRTPLHELPAGPQRKKGTRVGDLETKLGHVQDELRKLKEQLVSAESAKKDAEVELEETKKMIPPPSEADSLEVEERAEQEEEKEVDGGELAVKAALESSLEEKEKELQQCVAENASLKKQLEEAAAKAAAAWTREEEMALKLVRVAAELAESRAKAELLEEQLETADGSKSSLEAEMRRLKVQIDQWKKAADAAVTVLADTGGIGGGGEPGGRRWAGDKGRSGGSRYSGGGGGSGGAAEQGGGESSPPVLGWGDGEEWMGGGGRRKSGGGILGLGDLWKKKGPQK